MPGVEQNFRLNWASYGSGEKRSDDTADYTIFVGDLSHEVTDYGLQEAFRAHYPSVKGAKVVMDKLTGRPKGFGFVRFGDEGEQLRAISEMNGVMCAGRAMRIGAAASKKTVGGTGLLYSVFTSEDKLKFSSSFFQILDIINSIELYESEELIGSHCLKAGCQEALSFRGLGTDFIRKWLTS